jgi:hypothetical protein
VEKKTALYPDQYLFLVALSHVAERLDPDSLIFLGFTHLPEDHPDLADKASLLFSFARDNTMHQVAVARNGQVSWVNELPIPALGPNNSFKPNPLRSFKTPSDSSGGSA